MALSTDRLPRREREVFDAVFALGNRTSAEAIRARLVDPPSYSAVRAMLARLERKGFLKHRQEGARYVYSVTGSPVRARRAALQRYLDVFFGGSAGRLITTLLQDERWTEEDLNALQAAIDRARTEPDR